MTYKPGGGGESGRIITADRERHIRENEREKVLKEFLHRKREEADDNEGTCPYQRCVLCEIKDEFCKKKVSRNDHIKITL